MEASQKHSGKNKELTSQRLKPMWSPLFNLGLASFAAVIAAVVAFMSTHDLRDGGTLVAIPIGILVWFLGDILRWRGRYPMRLFLMVPIFVAVLCVVSIRFFQKANQRRMAWNAMIDVGASVQFKTIKGHGWVQYEEGVFLPEFLETWFGSAVFANSASVSIPLGPFAVGSPESRLLKTMELERAPLFELEISDYRNESKIDLDAISKLCNSKRVERLIVNLHSPNEESIKALQAIRRPHYLYLWGAMSQKAMRHLSVGSSLQYIVLRVSDPPDITSWLDFLPSSPNCVVVIEGQLSAASLKTINPERPLCKLSFQNSGLDDNAIQELAKLSKAEGIFIRHPRVHPSEDALHALFKSPATLEIGPVKLTPESVQLLIENEARSRLHLLISSIDSASFQRLAEVKCLKSIYLDFDLTEQDIQSLALFPPEVDITLAPNIIKNQMQQIDEAIKNRKAP